MIGNLIDYLEYRVLSSNFEFWDQLFEYYQVFRIF